MMISPADQPQFVFTDYGAEYRYGYGDYPEVEKIGYTTYRDGLIVVDVHAGAETVPWMYASELPVEIQFPHRTISFSGNPRVVSVTHDPVDPNPVYEVEVSGLPYTVSG